MAPRGAGCTAHWARACASLGRHVLLWGLRRESELLAQGSLPGEAGQAGCTPEHCCCSPLGSWPACHPPGAGGALAPGGVWTGRGSGAQASHSGPAQPVCVGKLRPLSKRVKGAWAWEARGRASLL